MRLKLGRRLNLTNQKFNRWLALTPAYCPGGKAGWICLCSCGNRGIVSSDCLISGQSKSCGCFRAEKASLTHRKHGEANKRSEYYVWKGMKARCKNKKIKNFKDYGGRGISVCHRWDKSFSDFIKDMGPRPKNASLDRIDNDGNYEPENCRWASQITQNNNRRNTPYVLHNGEVRSLSLWAKYFGVKYTTAYLRFTKGWPSEKIFSTNRFNKSS